MKRILIISVISLLTSFAYGQESKNKNNQPDSAKVFVSFVVETDGSITDVKVDKVECSKCSKLYKKNIKKEAIRVVSEMPNWEAHKERIKYILPIKFKFDDWKESK